MKTRALLLCGFALACAHAKQVEAPSEAKPDPAPQPVAASHPTSAPTPAPAPLPGHPVLTTSPAGTFEPGAIRTIQQALRDAGYSAPQSGNLDDATQHQLARYQKAQSMPDTGFPDDATLRKLKLDPAKLHKVSR